MLAITYPSSLNTGGGISAPNGTCGRVHDQLAVTFVVPPSGAVLVKANIVTAYCFGQPSEIAYGLLESDGTLVPNTLRTTAGDGGGVGKFTASNFVAYVNGLAPGTSKTFFLGHQNYGAGTSYSVVNQSDHPGTPCIEAWAAI